MIDDLKILLMHGPLLLHSVVRHINMRETCVLPIVDYSAAVKCDALGSVCKCCAMPITGRDINFYGFDTTPDGYTCAGCRDRVETPLGDASHTSEMVPHLGSVRAGFNACSVADTVNNRSCDLGNRRQATDLMLNSFS